MENTAKIADEIQKLESVLLSSLNEKFFFTHLSHYVKEAFKCDRVIAFKSLEDHGSEFIADSESPEAEGYRLEKGKGVSGYVIRTGRPYYSNSVARDPIFYGVEESLGMNAELCIPVTVNGKTIATLHLQNKSEDKKFEQEDINKIKEILNKIEKPLTNMKMYLTAKHLNEALQAQITEKEKELEKQSLGTENSLYHINEFEMIGHCSEIVEIGKVINKVANTKTPVLIKGESGVGKEVVAKQIHLKSVGEERPFVVVNSSIFTDETFEREMFGHVKGAFLGANIEKVGLCEIAHGGTLFFDDISQLSPNMQIKVLRFLETKKVYKIGSQTGVEVDVRVIASSSHDLQQEVEAGKFREDLYFMLKGFMINVPALKDRGGDIELLANFFLNENKSAMDHKYLSPEAVKTMNEYHWPGNIRELKNAMQRAYLMSEGKLVAVDHLPADVLTPEVVHKEEDYSEMTLEELERRHICRTLDHMKGNKTKTAKTLGITVKTLYNKLHSYGMIQSRDSQAN